MAHTFDMSLNNVSVVAELIPEFDSTPEFLRNVNGIDFGRKQDGARVDDVQLPPWAKQSPEELIRLHRAALESEHVSQHLHEWIDLIFGYKQRGKAAVEAKNIFFYLCYSGACDVDAIDDPALRAVTEAQFMTSSLPLIQTGKMRI